MDARIPDYYDVRMWARDIVIEEMRCLAHDLRERANSLKHPSAEDRRATILEVAAVIENLYPVPS